MNWPDLVASLGRCEEEQAFIYCAEIGTRVEWSAFGLNPDLQLHTIFQVLASRPPWLQEHRPDLLAEQWPDVTPEATRTDLVRFALLSCKAMLGFGSHVRDGSLDAMQQDFANLFPELTASADDSHQYGSCLFQVAIRAEGSHQTWLQFTGSRPGNRIPVDEQSSVLRGSWSPWETAMKNLLRLDLQRQLELVS